jgi:hypothetical protein
LLEFTLQPLRFADKKESPMTSLEQNAFKAWINKQPGSGGGLHVIGKVQASAGAVGTLSKAVPQGINPLILLLDLAITEVGGATTESTIDVRFDEEPSLQPYTSVQIVFEGPTITVPVEEVW